MLNISLPCGKGFCHNHPRDCALAAGETANATNATSHAPHTSATAAKTPRRARQVREPFWIEAETGVTSAYYLLTRKREAFLEGGSLYRD
jgi:hypothetical protein